MNNENASRIKPYFKNPMYWEYKGQPVLLLGGSKTDHIFLLDDLKEHLDEISSVGGNYVRNTMSQREEKEMKPHRLLENGKFDLDTWNKEYWKRFQNMLEWTFERDIIVQIEVWDRFDYSQRNWLLSPWNPVNNVNYTAKETGLAPEQPEPAWLDKHPFFYTIKGMKLYEEQYDIIRSYQEKFIDKMLSYSLEYGNVLYCMDNETGVPCEWGRYWIEYIAEKSKDKDKEIYLSDMFADVCNVEKSEQFRYLLDNPGVYDFVEISQVNEENFGDEHWQKLEWIFNAIRNLQKPVNNVKIYGNRYYSFGTGGAQDGLEKFMRDIMAGCASARFHRTDAGMGLNRKAKAAIKAVRKLESLMKMWELEPRMELLSSRNYNEAYLAAKPGDKYFLYFTYGEAAQLDLSKYTKQFLLKWIDINTGEWGDEATLYGGGPVNVTPPDSGGWIAAIVTLT